LLKLPSDSCAQQRAPPVAVSHFASADRDHRDICSHEFAHTLLDWGFPPRLSAALKAELEALRLAGCAAGRWAGAYARSNADEFWAELCMWHVGSRGDYGSISPQPRPGRRWLRRYDTAAAALVSSVLEGRHPLLLAQADEDGGVAELGWAAGDAVSSEGDGEACTLLVVNEAGHALRLSWVEAGGGLRTYAEVPPGGRAGQSTYSGHAWELQSVGGAGVVLGRVVACAGLGVVRVSGVPAAQPPSASAGAPESAAGS